MFISYVSPSPFPSGQSTNVHLLCFPLPFPIRFDFRFLLLFIISIHLCVICLLPTEYGLNFAISVGRIALFIVISVGCIALFIVISVGCIALSVVISVGLYCFCTLYVSIYYKKKNTCPQKVHPDGQHIPVLPIYGQ